MQSLQDLFLDRVETYSAAATGQRFDLSVLGDGLVYTRRVPDQVEPMEADEIHGERDGHTFYMDGDEFSVAIGSQGWEIRLDQAPSSKPQVMHLDGRVESVAAHDPAFIERANQLLTIRARRMYTGVACQRPRRSTMPDQKSRALHSISRGLSAEWHCLHCDGAHDGRTMAKNF
jgi:hypothetical protein